MEVSRNAVISVLAFILTLGAIYFFNHNKIELIHVLFAVILALIVYYFLAKREEVEEVGRADPLRVYVESAKTEIGKLFGMPDPIKMDWNEVEIFTNRYGEVLFVITDPAHPSRAFSVFCDGRKKIPHENRIYTKINGKKSKSDMWAFSVATKELGVERAVDVLAREYRLDKMDLLKMLSQRRREIETPVEE